LKWRALQCDGNGSRVREMLGPAECKRHRQDRRIRNKRRRGEMKDGTNCAVIVRIACGMGRWVLWRGGSVGCGDAYDIAAAAFDVAEMNMTERKDELQRHRCKRKPRAPPFIGTNPTHQANCPTSIRKQSNAGIAARNAIEMKASPSHAGKNELWRRCNKAMFPIFNADGRMISRSCLRVAKLTLVL
jgi:hypothetical protein